MGKRPDFRQHLSGKTMQIFQKKSLTQIIFSKKIGRIGVRVRFVELGYVSASCKAGFWDLFL